MILLFRPSLSRRRESSFFILNGVSSAEAERISYFDFLRSFTEPVLSQEARFFASLRMTDCEGLLMTIKGVKHE
jgi:hypothetical protein